MILMRRFLLIKISNNLINSAQKKESWVTEIHYQKKKRKRKKKRKKIQRKKKKIQRKKKKIQRKKMQRRQRKKKKKLVLQVKIYKLKMPEVSKSFLK